MRPLASVSVPSGAALMVPRGPGPLLRLHLTLRGGIHRPQLTLNVQCHRQLPLLLRIQVQDRLISLFPCGHPRRKRNRNESGAVRLRALVPRALIFKRGKHPEHENNSANNRSDDDRHNDDQRFPHDTRVLPVRPSGGRSLSRGSRPAWHHHKQPLPALSTFLPSSGTQPRPRHPRMRRCIESHARRCYSDQLRGATHERVAPLT